MTIIWNRTHLCADGDTEVRLRVADGTAYLEFGGDEQHMLTISGTPSAVTMLLLRAADLVINDTAEAAA